MKQDLKATSSDDRSEKLRKAILEQYGSISSFAKEVDIPVSTLATGLKNGIGGMSVTKVIKMCKALDIDIMTFQPKHSKKDDPPEQIVYQLTLPKEDDDLLKAFRQLNPQNKKKVQEYVGDLLELQTYRESNK